MRTLSSLTFTLLAVLGVSCAQEQEYYTPARSPVTPSPDDVDAEASVPVVEEGPHRPNGDAGVSARDTGLPDAARDAGPPDAARDARVDAEADAARDTGVDADANFPDADAQVDSGSLPEWENATGEQRGPVSLVGMCPAPLPEPPASSTCRAWPWHSPACYRTPSECAALHERTYCLSIVAGGATVFTGLDSGATCLAEYLSEYPLTANDNTLAQLGGDAFTTDHGVLLKFSLADGSFDVAAQSAHAVFVMGQQLVILSSDGRLLSYPSWSDIKLDQNGQTLATVSPSEGAVFGANAKTIVAAWPTGRIDLVTPGVSARVLRINDFVAAGESRIQGVDLSEDGSQIYLLTSSGIWTIDAMTGVTLRRLLAPNLQGLSCSPGLAPGVSVPAVAAAARPGHHYEPDRTDAAILATSDCAGPFNGPRYYGQASGPELLMIGTYFHELNEVVDERATPHTLVLTAIQGATWTVHVANGALLERIIVNGSSAVAVNVESATPVPVEYHLDNVPQGSVSFGSAAGNWPDLDQAHLQRNLEAYTGRPLTEFLGCYYGSKYTVRDVLPLCAL